MEKKKWPPAGSKCVVCGALLATRMEHDWAKARRGGIVYICPKCAGKKVNRNGQSQEKC